MTKNDRTISRRTALAAGAAGLALGGIGAQALPAHGAADRRWNRDRVQFDLGAPAKEQFRHKPMKYSTRIIQSIAFDCANGHLFIVQSVGDGGTRTDLCINRLDLHGNLTGAMEIKHAGHGSAIGCEPVGKDTYLWTEANATGDSTDDRGTAIARFKFVDGGTPDPRLFLDDGKAKTPVIDPVFHRLLVRSHETDGFFYTVYDLSDAKRGDYSRPLVQRVASEESGTTLQSWALLGRYVYTSDGNAQQDPGRNGENLNSYLNAIDLRTESGFVQRETTIAGADLIYREPEGLAVYVTPWGEQRLYQAYADRDMYDDSPDYASLYYTNKLISK